MDIKEPELASLLNIADRLKKVETALADILPLDQFIERIEKIETYISTSKEVLNLEEVWFVIEYIEEPNLSFDSPDGYSSL